MEALEGLVQPVLQASWDHRDRAGSLDPLDSWDLPDHPDIQDLQDLVDRQEALVLQVLRDL